MGFFSVETLHATSLPVLLIISSKYLSIFKKIHKQIKNIPDSQI